MSSGKKNVLGSVARFSTPLARDLFALGAEVGLRMKQQNDERNIAAVKQLEEKTEGRVYPRRHPRDE